MKICLVSGATTFEACKNTIKKIDTKNFEFQNLVVVPDAFSMQAENLVFDELNIKSTLNIEVVGISRLARKILQSNSIEYERISSLEEVFAIFEAVKENEENFKYFKKCGIDFCTKILQIIKQFKGCKVKPEQIKEVKDELLNNKIHDLKLIYISYEKILNEKLDLSKLLDFFVENAKNMKNLSKINLFFVNFDSFSSEINSFICKLANFVNQIFIGYATPLSMSGNSFIYEDDIFKKTQMFSKENSILVDFEKNPTNLTGEHLAMAKNLFSFEVQSSPSKFFLNYEAKNRHDEVEFVAKYIKNQIVNGHKFKDFQVAVADENYFDDVEQVFSKYKISHYCDTASDLSQTVLGQFIFKILHVANEGVTTDFYRYLLNSFASQSENVDEVLSKIWTECVDDEKEFLKICPQYAQILRKVHCFSQKKQMKEYIFDLEDILELTNDGYQKFLSGLDEKKYFKKQSENAQAKDLIIATLEKLSQIAGEKFVPLKDFEDLLKLSFESVKVETIPSFVDAVFVGDATDSYFEDKPILFVIGATSALPKSRADNGIIDDEDIKKLKANFVLEPEIKVLNRRNRLKIFELLQHATKKLVVTYPIAEEGRQTQKANFLSDLIKIFGANIVTSQSLELFDSALLSPEQKFENLKFVISNIENLPTEYSRLLSENRLDLKMTSVLKSLIKTQIFSPKKIEYINRKISKSKISASELETYFDCPFLHFVRYGLGINPNENIEPNKRNFGSFMHALLKVFIDENQDVSNITNEKIELFLSENIKDVAKKYYAGKIINDTHFIKFLTAESRIVLKNVVFEQKNSKFRPNFCEKRIDFKFYKDKNLVGSIDRVDFDKNYFRVIDYKTGKTDGVLKDLFVGKKLQLFLYANAVKDEFEKDCAGVYYFNCQTKFSKQNSSTKLLGGLTKKDNDVVFETDVRVCDENFKSDLIGTTLKKNATKDEFMFKYGNFVIDFEPLFSYAKKISFGAIDEIDSGYIEPKPIKDHCQNCKYISICHHKNSQGARAYEAVDEKSFKGGENE